MVSSRNIAASIPCSTIQTLSVKSGGLCGADKLSSFAISIQVRDLLKNANAVDYNRLVASKSIVREHATIYNNFQ